MRLRAITVPMARYYIQVWRRPEGVFQLEYRAGEPSGHYQTRTNSRDKIVSALSGLA